MAISISLSTVYLSYDDAKSTFLTSDSSQSNNLPTVAQLAFISNNLIKIVTQNIRIILI